MRKNVTLWRGLLGIVSMIVATTTYRDEAAGQPCNHPTARAWLRVSVANADTSRDTLWFGFHPTARYGRDQHLCEFELPPPPPDGIFDARWVNIPGRENWEPDTGMGQGFKFDYRRYVSRTHIDTHKVRFQAQSPPGYPMRFRWSPSQILAICDSARLIDEFGGILINARMHIADSLRVTSTAIRFLLLIRYGQKVVPDSIPSVPVLVSPPNGATNQPTAMTFVWRTSAQAQNYHIQVGTDSTFQTGLVVNDSTVADTSRLVSGLANSTRYFWRVRARNILGSSPYSTPFAFTTSILPPGQPRLISPPNGATNQPTTITFIWDTATGALTYRLQIATSPTFAPPLFLDDSTISGTQRVVSNLQNNTTYYWRVAGRNPGGQGPYSSVFTLTTIVAPPDTPPTLLTPTNGDTNVSLTPTLTWSSIGTATSYRLQVARDTSFTTLVVDDSTITSTSRQIGPLAAYTTYYWRVRAQNIGGNGPYSTRFRFRTICVLPPAPSLTSPPNGQQNTPITVMLSWGGVPDAIYRLQLGTDSTFVSGIRVDTTIATTSLVVSSLAYSTRYFWRVRAQFECGAGPYATPFHFTTIIEAPAQPTLVSPANNAVNVPLTTLFSWDAAARATSYHLQIARDSVFANLFLNDSTITTTSRTVSGMSTNTLYYWRVRGRNIGGNGPFSDRWSFRTTALPPAPALLQPPDSATRVSRTPTFIWGAALTATRYHLQVATDTGFTTLLVNDSTIVDTFKVSPTTFPYSTRLFWRVRGRNTAGWGAYPRAYHFFVMAEPPEQVTLVYPANNATNVPLTGPMRWRHAAGASWYNLQIALDTLMTNIFINDTAIIDSFRYVRLAPGTRYFWQVRARNFEGTYGNFSARRNFRTVVSAPLPPIPQSPPDGDTVAAAYVLLEWLFSPGASFYHVQLFRDSVGGVLVVNDSTVAGTSLSVGPLQSFTQYVWRGRARGAAGWSAYSQVSRFSTASIVSVEPDPGARIPEEFALWQNYPNPFNPSTTIRFEVAGVGFVSLRVYDMLGREVATLVNGELTPGIYERTFDATGLPSGMYLVRMVAASGHQKQFFATGKMMLMK